MYEAKMTRPKSERRCFGALLGRVFHVQFSPSKGMLFGIGVLIHCICEPDQLTLSTKHLPDGTRVPQFYTR